MHLFSFRLPEIGNSIPEAPPSWHDSQYVCALADSERHLGHVIKTDEWHAYDATRPDETGTSFRYIGAFNDLNDAKYWVETAAAERPQPKAMRAGDLPS
jgi:hypothetical protein